MLKLILVLIFATMIFSLSVATESNYQTSYKPNPSSKISANVKDLMALVEKNGKNQKIRVAIQFPRSKVAVQTDPKTFETLNKQVFIDHATKTQKSTIPVLNKLKKDREIKNYESHWYDNTITTIASPKAIRTLAALRDVQEIRVDTSIADVSSIVDDFPIAQVTPVIPVSSYGRPSYKSY